MVRLDISYFYRLAQSFSELRNLPDGCHMSDVWLKLYRVQMTLIQLFQDETIKESLKASYVRGNELYQLLDGFTEGDVDRDFSAFDREGVLKKLDNFESVLTSELSVADAYFVVDKPPFSTVRLIAEGETLFPKEVLRKVPDAIPDLKEAGKCLAFELPTACGFHLLRAMEVVIRSYWEAKTGNRPHPKQRNLGVYIKALREAGCVDEKVLSALTQIKDLHRNPVLHPDVSLSLSEVISLIGVARSVVDAMLKDIPDIELELSPTS